MPRSFFTILRFELRKAVRAKFTWVTLTLPMIAAALAVWLDHLTRRVQAAIGEGKTAEAPSAYLGFAKGMTSGFVIGGILLLLYSSMIMANEGHWRTFKAIMLRPHGRVSWVLGKFALLLILAAGLIAGVGAASFAAGACFGEYKAIVEDGYEYFDAAFMMKSSLAALALIIPPMVASAAFGLMFSVMTDHSGIATSACLGGYIVLETAKSSMPEGRNYLFNTFMPSLLDTSYLQALRGFAEGMSDTGWAETQFYYNIGTPLGAAALFVIVAAVIFRRRNFLN
ncbi:ABC transporter permease subunit [Candidatus Sumerlaeota bacterium]|nr:ABC transporter permease subunit [Candidatus Sumerlaeota bacterium]